MYYYYYYYYRGFPTATDLSNVLQQELLALERLMAHVTHVGRQFLVHQLNVGHEVALVVEAASTVRALVRLLTW
jgi:hypothetical protein